MFLHNLAAQASWLQEHSNSAHQSGSSRFPALSESPLFWGSCGGHIMNCIIFILEWKSTFNIVESTLKRVLEVQTTTVTIAWFPVVFHCNLGTDTTPKSVMHNMTPKRVDFHSSASKESKRSKEPMMKITLTHCSYVKTRRVTLRRKKKSKFRSYLHKMSYKINLYSDLLKWGFHSLSSYCCFCC